MRTEKLVPAVPGAKVKVYNGACLGMRVAMSVNPPLADMFPSRMGVPVLGARYPLGSPPGMTFTAVPLASICRPGATVPMPSTEVPTAACEKSPVTVEG